jgi:hypothetical protein
LSPARPVGRWTSVGQTASVESHAEAHLRSRWGAEYSLLSRFVYSDSHPEDLRRDFGAGMARVFAEDLADAWQSGVLWMRWTFVGLRCRQPCALRVSLSGKCHSDCTGAFGQTVVVPNSFATVAGLGSDLCSATIQSVITRTSFQPIFVVRAVENRRRLDPTAVGQLVPMWTSRNP